MFDEIFYYQHQNQNKDEIVNNDMSKCKHYKNGEYISKQHNQSVPVKLV